MGEGFLVMQERFGRVGCRDGILEDIVLERRVEVAATVITSQSSAQRKSSVPMTTPTMKALISPEFLLVLEFVSPW